MASFSNCTGSKVLILAIIPPLILLVFCLWILFKQIPHSLFQTLWQHASSLLQQQTEHIHTLSQVIFRHHSTTADTENGIPLTDIPSITRPSSVVTRRERFIIPPTPTIIPPTPPNISPRSSESFKRFDNIWTGLIPSPTAHRYPARRQTQHHIILSSASSSQVSIQPAVADNMSGKFSIDD